MLYHSILPICAAIITALHRLDFFCWHLNTKVNLWFTNTLYVQCTHIYILYLQFMCTPYLQCTCRCFMILTGPSSMMILLGDRNWGKEKKNCIVLYKIILYCIVLLLSFWLYPHNNIYSYIQVSPLTSFIHVFSNYLNWLNFFYKILGGLRRGVMKYIHLNSRQIVWLRIWSKVCPMNILIIVHLEVMVTAGTGQCVTIRFITLKCSIIWYNTV